LVKAYYHCGQISILDFQRALGAQFASIIPKSAQDKTLFL